MAVYGLAFEAGHGVFVDKSHTALEGLEVGLARGKRSRAGGQLLSAGGQLFLALSELGLRVPERRLSGSHLSLALFKSGETVLILLELCLTLGDHILHILGEIGNVVGNRQSELRAERTHDGHKPRLSAVKAIPGGHTGNHPDAVVAELDILVEHRHEGLDLAQKLLALVISLGVGVYLSLAFGDLPFALFKGGLARFVVHIALCEGGLALVVGALSGRIIAKTLAVGPDTVKVCLLVFLQSRDGFFKLADDVCRLCIIFLVLLDGEAVLDTEAGGGQTKKADSDEKNADNGGKR